MRKKVLYFSLTSMFGMAVFSGIATAKDKPGTITRQVKGGTIKMTPVSSPGTVTKKVKGGSIKMSPAKPKVDKWAFLPKVVATVDGKDVTKKDFIATAERIAKFGLSNPKKISKQVLTALINKTVLLKLAENAGIKPSADLVKSDFQSELKKLTDEQRKKFEASLKTENKSFKSLENEISKNKQYQEDVAIKNWIDKNIMPKVKVSQTDVDKFYKKHQNTLFKKNVKASHILIKPQGKGKDAKAKAKAKADKLLKQIKNGANFELLAEKNSECPSKSKKGDLGEFGRGQMVKPFEQAAYSMKAGEISDLVETQFGYHIIKVTKVNKVPMSEAKTYIENTLKQQQMSKDLETAISKEKAKMKIKTFI